MKQTCARAALLRATWSNSSPWPTTNGESLADSGSKPMASPWVRSALIIRKQIRCYRSPFMTRKAGHQRRSRYPFWFVFRRRETVSDCRDEHVKALLSDVSKLGSESLWQWKSSEPYERQEQRRWHNYQ